MDALRKALAAVGGPSRLAAAIGITPQAVGQWRRVPAERVLAVCRAAGGVVAPHDLRPDLYEPPRRSADADASDGERAA